MKKKRVGKKTVKEDLVAANRGEVSKPLIIIIITLVILAGLITALYFLGTLGTLVSIGKAFYAPDEMIGKAGFQGNLTDIILKDEFDFVIGANLGNQESTAFSFVLKYPEVLTVQETDITTSRDGNDLWGDNFRRVSVNNGVISFEHATIDFNQALTQNVELARIHFQGELTAEELAELNFASLEVLNLDDPAAGNIITSILQPSMEPPVVVSAVGAKELFIAKITALIRGECYDTTLYCNNGLPIITYTDGKLDSSEKIYIVAQISAALTEFFRSVVVGGSELTCTDSDGGKDYHVRGTTSSESSTEEFQDVCQSGGAVGNREGVVEFWCNNGNINNEFHECPNGCQDGACV